MKAKLYIILITIMLAISVLFIVYEPVTLMRIDNVIKDVYKRVYARAHPKPNGDPRILIVDIDEKSLAALGQWPWDRDVLACLQMKLKDAAVVGWDIYFAEADRRNELTKNLDDESFSRLHLPQIYDCKRHKDSDAAFAKALELTPSVLAYAVNLGSYKALEELAPAPLSNQSIQEDHIDYSLLAAGKNITASIEELSDAAYANGFVNSYSMLDGVIRSAYMLLFYDDGDFKQLLPSLSLSMYAKYLGSEKLSAVADNVGFIHIFFNEANTPNYEGVNKEALSKEILLNERGILGLNYEGFSQHYRYISAVDVLNGTIKPNELKDKLILIGTSSIGLNDIRATPLNENLPGVEVHAYALDNLLNNIYPKPSSSYALLELVSLIALVIIACLITYLLPLFLAVICIIICEVALVLGLYYLSTFLMMDLRVFAALAVFLLSAIGGIIINFILESKAKELIKSKLERKVSKQVAKELINAKNDVFASSRREISVFFSDIRDFTTISETLGTEELIKLLNEYMTPMSKIIESYGGTVDKYIGDAVMAYFNAPNDVKNHADAALMAAIEQIRALKELNEVWSAKGLPYINIGIGINTDVCIVGEMGSLERSDYTCIGDGVNTASRVESSCKAYRANILISEQTKNALEDASKYDLELVDELTLKGKLSATKLYKCRGLAGEGLDLWRS